MKYAIFALVFLLALTACSEPREVGMSAMSDDMEMDHDHVFDENIPHAHDEMHMHGEFVVEENPPTVELSIEPDAKSGYNVHIITENFVWDPANANGEHVDNHGHAHLYIDGVKITRIYSEWWYLPELNPGEHTIEVSLNTNTHDNYVFNGEVISASQTITV